MKLLLTAFEPFNGEIINPTMKIIDQIPESDNLAKIIFPVSYKRAFPTLQQRIEQENFTDILMLGQAGGRSLVSMERVALNWRDSSVADEDSEKILEKKISPTAPPAYMTSYPLRQWWDAALEKKLPIEISNSAGAFICNSISFEVADYLQRSGKNINWMFLHVPYLPEQVVGKLAGTASMPLAEMQKCVEFVIGKIAGR